MICNTCGREIVNEDANFCEYCGAPVRGRNGFDINTSVPPVNETVTDNINEKPISFLNWLGTNLLMYVPYVNIVMLFIWAFSHKVNTSKKNWARANLVLMGITLVILLIIINTIGIEGLFNTLIDNESSYYDIY